MMNRQEIVNDLSELVLDPVLESMEEYSVIPALQGMVLLGSVILVLSIMFSAIAG